MCLRLRKKKLAEILWECPPGADVVLTARQQPGVATNFSDFGFHVVVVAGSL